MKNFCRFAIVSILALTQFSAFAFLREDVVVKLRAPANGKIEDLAKKTSQPLTAGTDLNMTLTAPLLVTLEARIPMIIVPILAGTTEVMLNPPLIKDVTAAPRQRDIGNSVSEVLMGIMSIQRDLQRRDTENAQAKLDDLRKRFADVQFLEFVSGSILLLKGEKEAARHAIERGLEAYPNYKEGQEFLKSLGGADKSKGTR